MSLKLDTYEQAGVLEYWIANPKTRSIEVYTLSNSEYALLGEFMATETVTSNVLSGISLETATLFAPTS